MVRGADDAMRPELPDDVGAVHALLLQFRRERDEAVAQRAALVAERAALAQERDALAARNDRLRHLLAKLRRGRCCTDPAGGAAGWADVGGPPRL